MGSRDTVLPRVIDDEMKTAYLGYSMSVIVSRALPEVRDGLKPVHRRILYSMHKLGVTSKARFVKCARIVGDVIGKYHPHGDSAVYEALVRLAQHWSLRAPLIKGQGNFGSIDGDPPAAQRYTEAKMAVIAEEMLADIEKNTVEFRDNYDGSLKEPTILPARIPALLVNGASGIAVGMATNMPPHNLREVCDSAIHLIDNPEANIVDLMKFVKGPDFPTGAIICGTEGIKNAYATGRGKMTIRARHTIEEDKKRFRIVITELPYQVNKASLIQQIAELVRDKKVIGVSDIRDETGRNTGIRIVIYIKSNGNPDIVVNQLFKHTRLQDSFGINSLALVDGQPKTLGLKAMLQYFIDHRKDVVTRRTQFELDQAEAKAHIFEGLIIALDHIDEVIVFLKSAKNAQDAREGLMQDYKLSEKQSQAILDMKLQRLTGLEQDKIRKEHSELMDLIETLKSILSSEQKIFSIIKKELEEIRETYGDDRRTEILGGAVDRFDMEELIRPEDMVITITHEGYIKRIAMDTYKEQRRGGKGIIGADTKESDFLSRIFVANTHNYMLFFTNLGKVHWMKVYDIPEARRYARGTHIANLLPLGQGETIAAYIPVKKFEENKFLLFITQKGYVKKTSLKEFSHPRKGGIRALTIPLEDRLITVLQLQKSDEAFLATKKGLAIRFKESDVRPMGRSARGVIGIKLKRDDHVVGAAVLDEKKTILTCTKGGYGKRTHPTEYRMINRGGVGVINIKVTDKNGHVVAVRSVGEKDHVMIITQKGTIIRTPITGISTIGRNTQGVRIIRLREDSVVDCASVQEEDTNESSSDNS